MLNRLSQLRDMLTLSLTKLRTRKVRTFLTVAVMAIFAIVPILGSSLVTGLERFATSTPVSQLRDKNLAIDRSSSGFEESNADAATDPSAQKPVLSADKVKQTLESYEKSPGAIATGRVGTYAGLASLGESLSAPMVKFDLLPMPAPEGTDNFSSLPIRAWDREIFDPLVASGQSGALGGDGVIPILVSQDLLVQSNLEELRKIKDPDERRAKIAKDREAIIGKAGTLKVFPTWFENGGTSDVEVLDALTSTVTSTVKKDSPVELPVRIVGVTGGLIGELSRFGDDTSIVLPSDVALSHAKAKGLFNSVEIVFSAFSTPKERNQFVKESYTAEIFSDPVAANKTFFDGVKQFLKIVAAVLFGLLVIPVMFMLSKVLSDSTRETGVFRAIGARNRNILSIYLLYTIELALAAFALALAVAYGLALLLHIRYADNIARGIAAYADLMGSLSLVAVNPLHLTYIALALLASGILGASFPLFRALRRDPVKALRDE